MATAWRFICLLLLAIPHAALAGAWTLPAGTAQIISQNGLSEADESFDNSAKATQPIKFRKATTSLYAEYGLGDRWTAVAIPELDYAQWSSPGFAPVRSTDFSIAGGLRARLFDGPGVLSVQALVKSAGAHDSSAANDGSSGKEGELRFLYGTNFQFAGCGGFADLEIAQRWIDGPQPDETPIDLTIGFRVMKPVQILVQSFNIVSRANGARPYGYYRSHKLQLSAVIDLTDSMSLQAGGFFSPAGQNALQETGIVFALWSRF